MRIIGDGWMQNRSRNRGTAFAWGVLGGSLALALAASLVVAVTGKPAMLVFAAFFAAFALSCLRYARGALHAGLFVGQDEVVVRNPLKTVRLGRSDVERFVAGGHDYGFSNPVPGVIILGRDGGTTRVWTLAREGFVWHEAKNIRRWQATADDLNALLSLGESEEGASRPRR